MKKISFIWILSIYNISICDVEKIKLYSFYTSSHEELFSNWFLPSMQDDFELIVDYYEQKECPSGVYMSTGWKKIMLRKVNLIIRAIKENWDKIFIHADVDIQFFKSFQNDISNLIKNYDIVFQKDHPSGRVCAGFFISRGNKRTLELWEKIQEMVQDKDSLRHDQEILNDIIRKSDYDGATWNYLPETFFGCGTCVGKRWNPGDKLEIPSNIILHHANWTRGIKNKILQLKYVKDLVKSEKSNLI